MVRSMERSTWEASALLRTHMTVEAALASAIATLGLGSDHGHHHAPLYSPTRGLEALAPPTGPPPAADATAKPARTPAAAPRAATRRPARSPGRRG